MVFGFVRASAEELSIFSGATMGTQYKVTIVGTVLPELHGKIDTKLAHINALMSTYDPKSELSQFNQSRSTDWFNVSAETAHVVSFSLQLSKATQGAFDPTVGPAVNLWGFGPAGRRTKPPTTAEVAAIRHSIGYQQLAVCQDPPAIKKTNPTVYVDLSAVAKGYAVDELSKLLVGEGYNSFLVAIGGEIFARGKKPDGTAWQVGIEEPGQDVKSVKRIFQLVDMAVSTSGEWRNTFQHDGKGYSHIIDPRTAEPVTHDLASVTVFAESNIQTDSLSTALMVMGAETGIKWCDEHHVAALFYIRRDDDDFDAHITDAAKSFEVD
jgi:thiamine biosynthesis lipoprotein